MAKYLKFVTSRQLPEIAKSYNESKMPAFINMVPSWELASVDSLDNLVADLLRRRNCIFEALSSLQVFAISRQTRVGLAPWMLRKPDFQVAKYRSSCDICQSKSAIDEEIFVPNPFRKCLQTALYLSLLPCHPCPASLAVFSLLLEK